MVPGHFIYCGLCVFGSLLQEFSQYRNSTLTEIPHSPSFFQKPSILLLIFLSGLALDLYSLVYLPFLTFILLSSTHIVFFKYFYIADHDLSLSFHEKFGTLCILLSSGIAASSCGTQNSSQTMFLDSNFFIYGISSIFILLTISRLEFFRNIILLEASIPANISVFAVGLLKISLVLIVNYVGDGWEIAIVLYAFVGIGFFTMNSSIIKTLNKKHDTIVVFGAFQMWVLLFGFLAGLGFFYNETSYNAIRVTYCVLSGVIGEIGLTFLIYQQIGSLKNMTLSKNKPSEEEFALNGDPHSLELNIDEENLMDADIIDEDLLIKTIRNI
ncbi:hypothetical protein SteCoe_30991 [Stentor coeruleus]|uniref:Uncharacterized protein n=1 Tax=Stentor coeruleus TaxID=5963 RepID=A0A1R2B2B6_9CILI|nr:hypothetical protein SteCoe_30991 [Stentor coeruleus]